MPFAWHRKRWWRVQILLDESLPRTLVAHFADGTVETVFDRGWSGLKNGELLARAAEAFDVFLTGDQNLQYQQNLRGYEIRVVVLAGVTNRAIHLVPLLDRALDAARELDFGEVSVIRSKPE